VRVTSVRAVLWKEWKETSARLRGAGWLAVPGAAAVVAAWAGSAPWEVRAAAGLFALPALVAATWAGDSFVAERERRTLEPLRATPLPAAAVFLGKVLAAAALSWGLGAAVFVPLSGGAPVLARTAPWAPASFLAVLAAAVVSALASCRARTPAEAQGRAALHGAVAAGLVWGGVRWVGPARLVAGASSLRACGVDPPLAAAVALAAVDGLLAAVGIAVFAARPGRQVRRGGWA
jgi:hypothetical protein